MTPARPIPPSSTSTADPRRSMGRCFYHEMQLWASMGYFVFFCNPKGSDGRDNDFMDIFGHYGETDYRNLMDFADAVLMAWHRQIDPKRVWPHRRRLWRLYDQLDHRAHGPLLLRGVPAVHLQLAELLRGLGHRVLLRSGPMPRRRLHPGGAGDPAAAVPPQLRRERDDAHALHPLLTRTTAAPWRRACRCTRPWWDRGVPARLCHLPRGEPRALPLRQAQAPGPAADRRSRTGSSATRSKTNGSVVNHFSANFV